MHPQVSALSFLHFLQLCNFFLFSFAESTEICALNADDFLDVTLAKISYLIFLWMAIRFEAHKVSLAARSSEFFYSFSISTLLPTISNLSAILLAESS